jgi:hypothetical protein
VAWDGVRVEVAPELADLVAELRSAARPVMLRPQLVHGDIAGNVLFADGQVPAVIDFSPFWRPAGYALAVAAVDLLAWSRAPASILDELAGEPEIDQLLLRALVFRLVTESLGRSDAGSLRAVREANEAVVELVLGRIAGRAPPVRFADDRDLAGWLGSVLGREVVGLRAVEGGNTRAVHRIAELDDGQRVFVKAGGPGVELAVYQGLGEREFLPRLLASTRDPVLVLEELAPGGWVREWTPGLVEATRALLHEVHGLPAVAGVARLGAVDNPWEVLAAEPERLLRIRVCSAGWLDAHLGRLGAAAAEAPAGGDSLIHRDVRAANLWWQDGRLVLADWAAAAIGDPWLDHHLWLVALHAEGGPVPEENQGRHAAAYAALIAGQQPLLTPNRAADPELFEQRRRRLVVALAWVARLLGLPPPG